MRSRAWARATSRRSSECCSRPAVVAYACSSGCRFTRVRSWQSTGSAFTQVRRIALASLAIATSNLLLFTQTSTASVLASERLRTHPSTPCSRTVRPLHRGSRPLAQAGNAQLAGHLHGRRLSARRANSTYDRVGQPRAICPVPRPPARAVPTRNCFTDLLERRGRRPRIAQLAKEHG